MPPSQFTGKDLVSIHSRLKAAGLLASTDSHGVHGFNTQPPEGGWCSQSEPYHRPNGFNTQPPEGGWLFHMYQQHNLLMFQYTAA